MGAHLLQVATHGHIDVTVTWGAPIAFDEHSDRKQVARLPESEIRRRAAQALRGPALPASRHSFLAQNPL